MKLLYLVIFVLSVININGQNLVPNPGFEESSKCPDAISELNRTKYWFSPTKGSPDYYSDCSNTNTQYSNVGVPVNLMGKMPAKTGHAYVGFIAFNVLRDTVEREYLEVKLTSPLKADSAYCVSFYVAFATQSGYYTDAIGAYISDKPVKGKGWMRLLVSPQIRNPFGHVLKDKDWMLISGIYHAHGGEQYLTIGDFLHPDSIKILPTKHSFFSGQAYYYLDDVNVSAVKNGCACIAVKPDTGQHYTTSIAPEKIKTDSNIILNNIFFETDQATLLPQSFKELDSLYGYLQLHTNYNIELLGYTDNEGTENHNQKLSEARAQSVANYLISKGILSQRITYMGYGSSHPLAPNDTPENKQKNRRVEFRLSKTK